MCGYRSIRRDTVGARVCGQEWDRGERLCGDCPGLVDAYAKCRSIEAARKVFDEMKERNVMLWTAMIRGAAMFGGGDEAITLFERMVRDGGEALGVLSACSHSGMVDEGHRVFHSMSSFYNIAPKAEHYGCMVDMLSRAGLLDEALDLVEEMPMEADAAPSGLFVECLPEESY